MNPTNTDKTATTNTTDAVERAPFAVIDPPTDTDRQRVALHRAWVETSEKKEPGEHGEYVGIGAGNAGPFLARLWQCSRKEAFETAVRLAYAGQFRFHLHQWSYAFEFSPETYDEPVKHVADGFHELPMLLGELAEAIPGEEFRYQDTFNGSPSMALLVAFGKLVNIDFELCAADYDPCEDDDTDN